MRTSRLGVGGIGWVMFAALVALVAVLAGPGRSVAQRAPKVYAIPIGSSPQKGAVDAKLTVVVFSDWRCPACVKLWPRLAGWEKTYGAELRVVYKHFPVRDASRPVAHAAAAAAAQGQLWAFADRAVAAGAAIDEKAARQIAVDLGLDLKAFDAYVADGRAAAAVAADEEVGKRFGVAGAPAIFVNGRRLDAWIEASADVALGEELARAKQLIAQRPGIVVYDHVLAVGERGVGLGVGPGGRAAPVVRPGRPDPAKSYGVPVGLSPARGDAAAKVTIVMFGEFKCPYCARASQTLADLEAQYGKDLRLVFRHFVVHQATARPIARIAAAAAAQGRFWPFAARAWADVARLDEAGARKIAEDVGCHMAALDDFLAKGHADAAVDADIAVAARFGVNATPIFFINGRVLTGAQPKDRFVAIIDEELKKADAFLATQPKGTVYDHVVATGLGKVD